MFVYNLLYEEKLKVHDKAFSDYAELCVVANDMITETPNIDIVVHKFLVHDDDYYELVDSWKL